jgi:hypothetical protein
VRRPAGARSGRAPVRRPRGAAHDRDSRAPDRRDHAAKGGGGYANSAATAWRPTRSVVPRAVPREEQRRNAAERDAVPPGERPHGVANRARHGGDGRPAGAAAWAALYHRRRSGRGPHVHMCTVLVISAADNLAALLHLCTGSAARHLARVGELAGTGTGQQAGGSWISQTAHPAAARSGPTNCVDRHSSSECAVLTIKVDDVPEVGPEPPRSEHRGRVV